MFKYLGCAEHNPYIRAITYYAINKWKDKWLDKIIIADRISMRKYGKTISDSFYENGIPIDCVNFEKNNKVFDTITEHEKFQYNDWLSECDMKCLEQADKIDVKIKINNVFDFFNDIEDEFCVLDKELKNILLEFATEHYSIWKYFN